MFKRITAAVMAAIIAFLALPVDVFAHSNLTYYAAGISNYEEYSQIAANWMTNMVNNGKGVLPIPSNPDVKLCLMPSFNTKTNQAGFDHCVVYDAIDADDGVTDTETAFDAADALVHIDDISYSGSTKFDSYNRSTVKYGTKEYAFTYNILGTNSTSANPTKYMPTEKDHPGCYGAIGVMYDNSTIAPVYQWTDTYTEERYMTAFHAMHSCRPEEGGDKNNDAGGIANLDKKLYVTSLDIYTYIMYMHRQFHDASTWEGMSGDDKKKAEELCTAAKTNDLCADHRCPFLNTFIVTTSNASRSGDVEQVFSSAASLYIDNTILNMDRFSMAFALYFDIDTLVAVVNGYNTYWRQKYGKEDGSRLGYPYPYDRLNNSVSSAMQPFADSVYKGVRERIPEGTDDRFDYMLKIMADLANGKDGRSYVPYPLNGTQELTRDQIQGIVSAYVYTNFFGDLIHISGTLDDPKYSNNASVDDSSVQDILTAISDLESILQRFKYGESGGNPSTYDFAIMALQGVVDTQSCVKHAALQLHEEWVRAIKSTTAANNKFELTIGNSLTFFDLMALPYYFRGEELQYKDKIRELYKNKTNGVNDPVFTNDYLLGPDKYEELDNLFKRATVLITNSYIADKGPTWNISVDYDSLFNDLAGTNVSTFLQMLNDKSEASETLDKDTWGKKARSYVTNYKNKQGYVTALIDAMSQYVDRRVDAEGEGCARLLVLWNQFVSVSKGAARKENVAWEENQSSALSIRYKIIKTKESNISLTTPNIVSAEQLSLLEFRYNAQKNKAAARTGRPGTLLQRALTLSVRADVIDYCASNHLEPTDFVKEVMSSTDILINDTLDGDNAEGLFDYYDAYPLNDYHSGDYFYYQGRLAFEALLMSDLIFFGLLDVLNGFATLEDQQLYIDAITNIKEVCDRYQSVFSSKVWNNPRGAKHSYEDVMECELAEGAEDSRYTDKTTSLSDIYQNLIDAGLLSFDEYTVDIYEESNPMTLFWTSNGDASSATFSKEYLTGRALSATYIPMQTNLYDPYTMFDYVDTEWIENYQFKYGFHRKALYIDTNPDAAVDTYVSHTVGSTRLATLRDLFNCEQDIVLYIDDNFYNIKSLAEKQEKTYDRLSSADYHPSWLESFLNAMMWWKEVDFPVALKHAETNVYSETIAENISDMSYKEEKDENGDPIDPPNRYDSYLLTGEQIQQYLTEPDYSDMMSFAFVSAIYRQTNLYNSIVDCVNQRPPVFVSSPTLATLQNADDDAKNTIYNYALLKNLPAMTTVGYENSTDMTSPIYVDIYGNIVTESGLVVVPAAANASLHTSRWQPICTGFLASYGKEWSIPANYNLDEEWMSGGFFTKNEEEGIWQIRNKRIQNTTVDFATLSYSDKTVNTAIRDWYSYDLVTTGQIDNTASLNVLHETMRGAPLENIDFAQENLNTGSSVTAAGLVSAAKLDSIINSLDWDDENSIMSVPNLSFIDNYQYVVVIVFKILLVIVVIAIMLTVYIDVLKAAISWKTLLRSVGILVIAVVSVLLIPVSYDIAYYQSNKYLLQDEAEYIMMLNTEKNMSGREIGIYSVAEPENNTKIYIKLENFEFNWLEVLPDVIFGDSITVLDERYKEFLANSLIANQPNVLAQNDGMYMDVQDIFDTSTINFNTSRHALYQRVSVDPVASYYIPYYYFLDALIKNMNDYNSKHSLYAYSTKIMRGGAVKTVNLCNAYFTSKEFMEDDSQDFLGLAQIYNSPGSIQLMPIFDEESAKLARSSQWVTVGMDEDGCAQRITLMTQKMREFVSKNRNLIGKVTDETFLKCMAMSLALDYNELFGIPSASALEIYNLSNADLMRLSIADKATTLEDSPMSFARFVYTEADTPGVYASVFLVIVTMFVQTMKTVITIAIMALLIISVFVFKILLRKPSHSIAGYLLTLLVICSTNILYAIILKISLLVPQTGLAPTVCILLQIIVQLAYLFLLSIVLSFALRDWKNAGFTMYQTIGHNVKAKFQSMFDGHRQTSQERYDSKPRGVDGWDYYHKLVKENERRIKKVGNH